MLKTKTAALLVLGCSIMTACAVRRVSRDYDLTVMGYVATEDGMPLQNVEVVLQVETPIYNALTPVTSQRVVTDNNGLFALGGLSHNSVTKYTVTVRKDGFEPQTVSGSSPPDAHLVFRLKKASSNGVAPQHE